MDAPFHRLSELFAQLGLGSSADDIERFVAMRGPLPDGTTLCDAPFWTPAQAQFLREQIQADADWSVVVDELAVRLGAAAR